MDAEAVQNDTARSRFLSSRHSARICSRIAGQRRVLIRSTRLCAVHRHWEVSYTSRTQCRRLCPSNGQSTTHDHVSVRLCLLRLNFETRSGIRLLDTFRGFCNIYAVDAVKFKSIVSVMLINIIETIYL